MKRSSQAAGPRRLKRFVLFVGPIFCLSLCKLQPTAAFFNCFTPNMFKMGKVGHSMGSHPGERANWYPQMSVYQGYGQNPMSRLFKPRWMGGVGLFGPKRWMDWRMNAPGPMNYLYRPNQAGYWSPLAPPASYQYTQIGDTPNPLSYPANSQQIPPYGNIGPSGGGGGGGTKLSSGPYNINDANRASITQTNSNYNNNNDGWTYPSVSPFSRPGGQSGQLNYGSDSYSVSPNNYQSAKQQVDQYGTKSGGMGTKTAKKILIADGARQKALQEVKK